MIYSLDKKLFPTKDKYLECHSYNDENGFEWRIARVVNGFFLAYFGDSYFRPCIFCLEVKGRIKRLNNTDCFFIQNTEFDVFYQFRNILKTGWTDDIWEAIEDFLTTRLENDDGLTEFEKIKNRQ